MTVTAVPVAARPRVIRVQPAPRWEPPFDDEIPAIPDRGAPGPELPMDWRPGTRPERRPLRRDRHDQRQPDQRDQRDQHSQRELGQRELGRQVGGRADRGSAPEPERPGPAEVAAERFVRACREVLDGFRPVRHLRVVVAPECLDEVSAELTRPRRRRGPAPARDSAPAGSSAPARDPGPSDRPGALGRFGSAAQPGSGPGGRGRENHRTGTGASGEPVPARGTAPRQPDRVGRRRVLVTEPLDGVAEVTAVLVRGPETWAMAFRLERRPTGWLCTFLQVL